jgi:tetratricopeptide (TPR) repeat protein
MLALRDGLMAQENLVLETYPHYNVLPEDLNSPFNIRYSSFIIRHSPLGAGTRGADRGRRQDCRRGAASTEGKPILYEDVLTALSRGGEPEGVLALYEAAPPPQPTQAVSDTVALAYLDQVTRGQGEGETRRGEEWEKVLELRPGDLYANYHLWKRAQEAGDVQAAAAYSETLTYFPLEAVAPTDERLLGYAAQVIPALLEEGVWDREKMLNVVSYLVWQHNTAAGVVRLLEGLTARYPAQPDWPFYLAELYHRRGDLDRAETAYKQVLQIDPDYAQAYLRLGMIYEARAEREKSCRPH